MPTISRFYGIRITMFPGDHAPPHFHVQYGSWLAIVSIESLNIIEGRLPARALRIVRQWAQLRNSELVENWRLTQSGLAPKRIKPLD